MSLDMDLDSPITAQAGGNEKQPHLDTGADGDNSKTAGVTTTHSGSAAAAASATGRPSTCCADTCGNKGECAGLAVTSRKQRCSCQVANTNCEPNKCTTNCSNRHKHAAVPAAGGSRNLRPSAPSSPAKPLPAPQQYKGKGMKRKTLTESPIPVDDDDALSAADTARSDGDDERDNAGTATMLKNRGGGQHTARNKRLRTHTTFNVSFRGEKGIKLNSRAESISIPDQANEIIQRGLSEFDHPPSSAAAPPSLIILKADMRTIKDGWAQLRESEIKQTEKAAEAEERADGMALEVTQYKHQLAQLKGQLKQVQQRCEEMKAKLEAKPLIIAPSPSAASASSAPVQLPAPPIPRLVPIAGNAGSELMVQQGYGGPPPWAYTPNYNSPRRPVGYNHGGNQHHHNRGRGAPYSHNMPQGYAYQHEFAPAMTAPGPPPRAFEIQFHSASHTQYQLPAAPAAAAADHMPSLTQSIAEALSSVMRQHMQH